MTSRPAVCGWSGIGGQTNMAYVLDRNPCGSSSGSAVIVSAGLAVAAVGTETDGSIVCPSGANANAAIKPTVGLLSRAGVIPISADQDTAPMARSVTDAAVLLGAMTGIDAHDPATTGGRDADCAALRAIATPGARSVVDAVMATYNLDAIIAPTNRPAWVTDPVNGDLGGDFSTFIGSSSPAAVAGYANVTVPAGFVGPLPVGVSFIGGRWDEPKLIGLAYAFEQATRIRVPPHFIPTIGGDAATLRGPGSQGKGAAQRAVVPGRGIWRMPPF